MSALILGLSVIVAVAGAALFFIGMLALVAGSGRAITIAGLLIVIGLLVFGFGFRCVLLLTFGA